MNNKKVTLEWGLPLPPAAKPAAAWGPRSSYGYLYIVAWEGANAAN